eukprot:gene6343-11777_t
MVQSSLRTLVSSFEFQHYKITRQFIVRPLRKDLKDCPSSVVHTNSCLKNLNVFTTGNTPRIYHRENTDFSIGYHISAKLINLLKKVNRRTVACLKENIAGVLRDLTPRDLTPRDLTPRDLTPRDLTPKDLTPRDLTPRDLTSRDLTPRDLTPRDLTPRDLTPRDLTPRDLTPKDLTPKDLTPRDLTPKDLTPRDLTPKDLTPRDLTPKDLTPRDLTPKDLTPRDLNRPYGTFKFYQLI